MQRAAIIVGLAAAVILTGCRATSRPAERPRPAAASASLGPPPNPTVPRKIEVLSSPHDLLSEIAYPPRLTRQRFVWENDGYTWRLRFSPGRYAYSGIILRRPIDVHAHYRQMRLMFKIKPARSAAFLSIALVDRPETNAPVLSDVALSDKAPPLGDDWTTVSIPLNDFPSGAPIATGKTASADNLSQAASTPRRLDWTCIREIRVISSGGHIPAEEILIREIRIQRL